MGTLYTRPYGFQIRVTNKLTPKDLWAPFDTRGAAEQYMHQLDALLYQGIVPAALLERSNVRRAIWTVQRCVVEYVLNDAVPPFRPKAAGHDHVPAVFLIGIGVIANLLLDMLADPECPAESFWPHTMTKRLIGGRCSRSWCKQHGGVPHCYTNPGQCQKY